jgi:hypothetical protein
MPISSFREFHARLVSSDVPTAPVLYITLEVLSNTIIASFVAVARHFEHTDEEDHWFRRMATICSDR